MYSVQCNARFPDVHIILQCKMWNTGIGIMVEDNHAHQTQIYFVKDCESRMKANNPYQDNINIPYFELLFIYTITVKKKKSIQYIQKQGIARQPSKIRKTNLR